MTKSPSLRFSEFNAPWEKIKLGNFIRERKKKSKVQNEHTVLTSSRNGLVLQSDYYSGNERIVDRDNVGFNVIFPNDLTYRSRSDDRQFYFNENTLGITGILSSYYPVFELVGMDNKFFTNLCAVYKHKIGARSVGTSQTVLSMNELKSIELPIPSLNEQQKISDFLSSVDSKINILKEKHGLLTQYKKGVMQKLFTQEIRFKDDNSNDFPDWESVTLSELMTESRIKGSTGDKARKMTVKLWGKGVFEKNDKLGGSENTQYYKRKSGQFIYSKLDFLNCAFGIVPDELDGLETTVDLPCFDIKDGINKNFILEYIKQKRFYKKYGDMADGSRKAKRIHAETFLNFPVSLPCEKEQDKIADFLTAIDKKLDAVNQQIELTQTFKKGLLQQMFV